MGACFSRVIELAATAAFILDSIMVTGGKLCCVLYLCGNALGSKKANSGPASLVTERSRQCCMKRKAAASVGAPLAAALGCAEEQVNAEQAAAAADQVS